MIIELHILQNLAPSNVNRDETGAPKDCHFGGTRRARISSQAFKRAMRREFSGEFTSESLAIRTKRAANLIADQLVARGRDAAPARKVGKRTLDACGIAADKKRPEETGALAFFGADEIARLADFAEANWDVLVSSASVADLKNEAKKALGDSGAVDLALFGRMLADLPDHNVEAAAQVAHAISTNQLTAEFDYFTAMDDLQTDDESGAAMIESTGFNSSCFYRYLNVDVRSLIERLGPAASQATIEAYIRAAVSALPTGKQNSMAAHNPPSFVMAVVRERGHMSLANAFVRPVRPSAQGDLVSNSIRGLDTYWGRVIDLYGDAGVRLVSVATLDPEALDRLAGARTGSLDALIASVTQTAIPEATASETVVGPGDPSSETTPSAEVDPGSAS